MSAFAVRLGSGLPIVADKVSPNLNSSTPAVSNRALNFLSPACLPIPPSRHSHLHRYLRKKHRWAVPFSWSERRGSNPRPRPWQGRALPAELLSHCPVNCLSANCGCKSKGFRSFVKGSAKKFFVLSATTYQLSSNKATKKPFRPTPASRVISMADRKLAYPLSRCTRLYQTTK